MVRLVLVLLVVGAVLAVKFLPWWGGVLLGVGALVAARYLLPRMLRRLFIAPFVAKGRVLRGATVQLLGTSPDTPFEWQDKLPEAAKHVAVELTIKPAGHDGAFQAWEPSSLELVRADAPPEDPYSDDDDAPGEEAPPDAVIGGVEVWQDGAWVPNEGWKLVGEQRLRLRTALSSKAPAFKFRYYFEDFGTIPRAA